jgi:hypothetical protein
MQVFYFFFLPPKYPFRKYFYFSICPSSNLILGTQNIGGAFAPTPKLRLLLLLLLFMVKILVVVVVIVVLAIVE